MDKKTKTALLEEKARALRERADYLHSKFVCARHAQVAVEEEIERPKLNALIGKCFRYENSYGGGGGGKKWDLYSKVLKVDFNPHGNHFCEVLSFQIIPFGRGQKQVEFKFNHTTSIGVLGKPVSDSEFRREYRKAIKVIEREL